MYTSGTTGQAQGHHLHPPQHRLEAALPRLRAAGHRRGRHLPRLPAALPHLRPLPGADRHAVVGRDLRLRPLHGAGLARSRTSQSVQPDRLHLASPRSGWSCTRRARREAASRGRRGRRGPAPGPHRRPAALRPLGGRLPRPGRLPGLPPRRGRALLRLRHDRGHRRHHHDAAGRVRGRLHRQAAARASSAGAPTTASCSSAAPT